MRYPWRYITLGFLAGLLMGALVPWMCHYHFSRMTPDEHRARILAKISSDLQLDETQRPQVDAILRWVASQKEALTQDTQTRMDALRASGRSQIRQLLRPDQQARFDRRIARLDARRKRMESGTSRIN